MSNCQNDCLWPNCQCSNPPEVKRKELCKKFCGTPNCECIKSVWFEIENEQKANLLFKVVLTGMVGVLIVVLILFILVLLFAP